MAKRAGKTESPGLPTHVALLRGINVGGRNRLPMVDLAKFCTSAGCANVQTYIQSGNVVFTADAKCAASVPAIVEKMIEQRFGFRSPVIVRSGKDLQRLVHANPFLRAGGDTEQLYVGFLSSKPSAKCVASLDPKRSAGDSFEVIGTEIYMNLAANGAAKTKLTTAYLDSKLETVSTFRNWRTVLRLHEMLSPLS